jgi:transcriptional regulator with XRE-family HTH domain
MRNDLPDSEARRRELSAFLRTRRARINPTDVGLLNGARRRTPGLRREEVALLANIGVTWYTRLEQGLPINVSPEVLTSISSALQLTTRERDHLFVLAGQPITETTVADSERISEQVQRVLDALDPSPALVRGRRYDILAWNRGAVALFGDYAKMDVKERNSLWRYFMRPEARLCFPKWDDAAPKFVAQFRAIAAKYLEDPCFTSLINELLEASPEFRRYWSRHDVASVGDGFKHIYHPVAGELKLDYTLFSVPNYPDMSMIVYTAAKGSVDEQKLRELVDGGVLVRGALA